MPLFFLLQVRCDRPQHAVLCWSHCNPPQFRQLWRIDSTPSASSQFRRYGREHLRRFEKLRQQMNQACMMRMPKADALQANLCTLCIPTEFIFRHFMPIDAVVRQFDKEQGLGRIRPLSRRPANNRTASNSLTATSVLAFFLNPKHIILRSKAI